MVLICNDFFLFAVDGDHVPNFVFLQVPVYSVWAQSLVVLCSRNKTITPSAERFLTSLYIFYDFATTQGSGNIVNFWGVDRYHDF